jgi:predicted RNA-binding protein YlxR (DUF448 family)
MVGLHGNSIALTKLHSDCIDKRELPMSREPTKVPVRTCLGCMERDYQASMFRLIALADRTTLRGPCGQGGRGGYLHPLPACLQRFERSRVKEFRSLKRRVGSDERRAITELIRNRLVSQDGVE